MRDLAYLKLLSREYPTVRSATSEIINLMAICGLPKGTEYFFSDLHGEYEAFVHLLRSSSGIIREKIRETFGHLIPEEEEVQLANLIYYPDRNLGKIRKTGLFTEDFQKITIYRLVQICKVVSSKYTRSKVRKKMPKEFAYVIDELLHVDYNDDNKRIYYSEIIHSIIDNTVADKFIIALCELIQNLTIDNLHIIGDIFDRGPRADIIMDELMHFHDVDIQWGNHDISWMGAATGNLANICNVLRIAISYNSFDVLEDGYGINLRPLSMFAAKVYRDDPCERFVPHILDENVYDAVDPGLAAKMHKAIAVIQFKVEGAIIKRHPEYGMADRILLEAVDFEKGTVTVEGKEYPMLDRNFPTVDPANPLELTDGEKELLKTLKASFKHSGRLHKHVKFLYSHGAIYKCYNSNLLYHGCIPMRADGNFDSVMAGNAIYSGRSLMDYFNYQVQNAYFMPEGSVEKQWAMDLMWYLWCGSKSPVFGKDKMTTFEHYFIADKKTHKETLNPYYKLSVQEEFCDRILEEFDLPAKGSHIINGHVPVKMKDGETPVKAGGKLFIIDGGLSKAYQAATGIAGYTLIYNSNHLALAEHMPFDPNKESSPRVSVVEKMQSRVMVADTDKGRELAGQIADLKELVAAYREGTLKERVE
ncbi:fructose-1,6-bisphosphatase [Enterocloster asparagiformis]|uniref:Fructose-1,6-bisphosphatase class 3 n=1 Tax=Enterocloster asparagiformis TaxID=333367 RepID=A0A413FI91_9FIRM|nr:fructose-1,6-bisphosphatase [Enterocloster asparagiformis]RGX30957.1 fructose-1,6-bisphosphatase [Enterocloster asparagiformis]